jgi:NitT/TauT family transport system substrate-binding protein
MSGEWVRRGAATALLLSLAGSPAMALDKVTVAKSGTAMIWTAVDVGQAAKIWESVGIEVEALQLGSDARLQEGLTAGAFEFGLGSGPSTGYKIKGVPATAVAALAGPPYSFFVVVPTESKLRSVDDLKGHTVAVTSAGSLTDWLVRELSRQKGWGSDGVKPTPLGAMRSSMAAMKNSDVDGVVVTSGPAYEFENHREARILFSFGDIVTHFHTHMLIARNEVIEKKPDLVQRFVNGWFKSVAYMKSHKDLTTKIAAKSLEISPEAADKAYEADVMKMMLDDGRFSPEAMDVIRHSLVQLNILEKVPEAKALYTDRFVPAKF